MDDEVRRLLMTYLHRPAYGLLSKQDLLKRSYEDWACGELIYRITDHPFDDPINIIEAFAYEMLSYSIVVRENEDDQNFVNGFKVCNELANKILLQFEHPKE